MGMHLAMAGINHQPFHIWLINDLLKQSFPNTSITPAAEPPMSILPVTVACRKITPRRSSTQNPEDSVKKASIVMCDASPLAAFPEKKRLKDLPGSIR